MSVEVGLDETGKYDAYSLQEYDVSAVLSCDRAGTAPGPVGLALSSSVRSLCVCPVSGRVMVLLSNGILIIVQAVVGVFELILEMVSSGFRVCALAVQN